MDRRRLRAQYLSALRRQGRRRGPNLVAACLAACCRLLSCGQPEVDSQAIGRVTVRIDASQRLNSISDLLYGHFAEFMFENIKQGLWAELLVNRGFEDVAPTPAAAHYWERYPDTRNHPNGYLLGGEAHGITEQGYPPAFENRAQLLTNLLSGQRGHGIYRLRVALREGVTYGGSLWLRATGARRGRSGVETGGPFAGRLAVPLAQDRPGGAIYAFSKLEGISPDWAKHDFQLSVGKTDPRARFVLRVFGVGTIWIDQASVMPDDARNHIRADVLERAQRFGPHSFAGPGATWRGTTFLVVLGFKQWRTPVGSYRLTEHWSSNPVTEDFRPTAWWGSRRHWTFGDQSRECAEKLTRAGTGRALKRAVAIAR